MNKLIFITIQFIFLIDGSQQSKTKQASMTFKAISNTIKNPAMKTIGDTIKKSVKIFRRKKNIIKNFACGIEKQVGNQLRTRHNIGSRSVKYLGGKGIDKFKYIVPQAAREGKKNIQINGKGFRLLGKKSVRWMGGKELGSLINMVSKSKPQIPFLFAGGLMRHTEFNLAKTDDEYPGPNQERKWRPGDDAKPDFEEQMTEPKEEQLGKKSLILQDTLGFDEDDFGLKMKRQKSKKASHPNSTSDRGNRDIYVTWNDVETRVMKEVNYPNEDILNFKQINTETKLKTAVSTMNLHLRDLPHYKCLIFIHGSGGSKTGSHAKLIKQVAKDKQFGYVSFDLYGHGRSSQKRNDVLFSNYKDQLRSVLMKYVTAKNAILVGYSVGSNLAIHSAVEKDLMDKVVGSLLLAPGQDNTLNNIMPNLNKEQLEEYETSGKLDFKWKDRVMDTITKDYVEDLKANHNFLEEKKIKVDFPVTIIHSKDDQVIPHKAAENLMEKLDSPYKKLVSLEDSGHAMRDEATDKQVADGIDDLLHAIWMKWRK